MDYRLFKTWYTDRKTGERRETDTHYIAFRDHLNRRQKLAGSVREREAHTLAGRITELVRCRRSGEPLDAKTVKWLSVQPERLVSRLVEMDIIDPLASSTERTLIDHLEGVKGEDGKIVEPGYRQALIARGDTEQHASQQVGRIKAVFDACGFTFWRDLNKSGAVTRVEVYLGDLRAKKEINGSTFNAHVRAIGGYCRWMVKAGKAPFIALANLATVKNADADAKPRRELSPEEMRWLLYAAEKGTDKFGVSGADRALLYRFAFLTGLRPGQIRALTVADFDLKATPPMVRSQAKFVKRRKRHEQVLHPSLVALLKPRFDNKVPAAPALTMPSKFDMAQMLRHDLAEARRLWLEAATGDEDRIERGKSDFLSDTNHESQRTDFYSIRHGHGTALGNAGIPEKDIAASMHHTNRSTTQRYLHTSKRSLTAAIEALPDLAYPLAATGTDDRCLDSAWTTATTGMDCGGQSDPTRTVSQPLGNTSDMGNSAENADSEHVAQLVEQRTFNP